MVFKLCKGVLLQFYKAGFKIIFNVLCY